MEGNMSNFKTQKWKTPDYSKHEIEQSGKTIIHLQNYTYEEIQKALCIVDNWRSSHAYPLHVIYMNLRRLAQKNKKIIIAQRLKRFDSILGKLERFPNMNLWRVQDLGGCRVILPTNDDVYNFSNRYMTSRIRHKLKRTYDYIEKPKESGYRSLHLVYEYKSDNKNSNYNKNMLIEIQFRTQLQHMWATAVETMGVFTHQSLKSGKGDKDINRFFALVSSLFALEEKKPIVPNTPSDVDEIIHEIESINAKHNYLDKLSAIKVVVDNQDKRNLLSRNGFYILKLNFETHRLKIFYFKPSDIDEANKFYDLTEQEKSNDNIDVVLVRVESFKTLKNAYPNYFSDIGNFIKKVKSYLN